MADFGVMEDGHPDEVVLPGSHGTASSETPQARLANGSDPSRTAHGPAPPRPMQPPARPLARTGSNGPPPRAPHTPNQPPHRPGAPIQGRPNPNQPANLNQSAAARPQPQPQPQPPNRPPQQAAAVSRTGTPPPNGAPSEPVAFFSARSVPDVPETAPPGTAAPAIQGAKLFDPRAESPSIRKTAGIDHHSSRPVAKNGQHVPPPKRDLDQPRAASPRPGNGGLSNVPAAGVSAGRPAVGNPMLHNARQIGAPGAGGSPLANRNSYKPPTVKRPTPGVADGANRPALTDVTNNGPVGAPGGGGGPDVKRQKMT